MKTQWMQKNTLIQKKRNHNNHMCNDNVFVIIEKKNCEEKQNIKNFAGIQTTATHSIHYEDRHRSTAPYIASRSVEHGTRRIARILEVLATTSVVAHQNSISI